MFKPEKNSTASQANSYPPKSWTCVIPLGPVNDLPQWGLFPNTKGLGRDEEFHFWENHLKILFYSWDRQKSV